MTSEARDITPARGPTGPFRHDIGHAVGGYLLARSAEAISLLEVIEAVEGESRRRTCVLRNDACRTDAPGGECALHRFFFAAQEALLGELANASLAELNAGRETNRPSRDNNDVG